MKAACLFALALAALYPCYGQTAATPKSYLVKLSVPVSVKASKPGDSIRAAIISPESLLNGYLEGTVQEVTAKPVSKLVLRFQKLMYKGASTAIQTEVSDFVNSKGHKGVDDVERPIKLENGAFTSSSSDLWLDEGSELRVRAGGQP